ncbi:MAG: hypothetical protein ABI843_14190 [Dokdonella sp.]
MQVRGGHIARVVVMLGFGAVATTAAARTFEERDIKGTWVLTAEGAMLGTQMPLALLGVIEFEQGGHCSMNGTINAGGLSWSAIAASCGFQLQSNGSGSLIVKLPPGPVVMSAIPLSFVVIDEHEIRTMATDSVSLSGVLRKQDH